MIEFASHADGVVLPVKAMPGAKRNGLRGVQDGALKVSVTQIAEKGKANKAIAEVLCKALGLKRSQIELIGGETSTAKRFLVRATTIEALSAAIQTALRASK
jgi:hypothetical protein